MCVAELNRSTGPCAHTYFTLNRACSSATSLANCAKLSLSGWENRTDACAVCSGGALVDTINYRVLGGGGSDDGGTSTGAWTANISRTNSFGTMTSSSFVSGRRDSRRGSLARSDSSSGDASQPASERNASRNQRVDAYLAQLPQATYNIWQQSAIQDHGGGGGGGRSAQVESDEPTAQAGSGGRPTVMTKLSKKSRNLSRDIKAFF